MTKGWKLESARHSLARRGIESGRKSQQKSEIKMENEKKKGVLYLPTYENWAKTMKKNEPERRYYTKKGIKDAKDKAYEVKKKYREAKEQCKIEIARLKRILAEENIYTRQKYDEWVARHKGDSYYDEVKIDSRTWT